MTKKITTKTPLEITDKETGRESKDGKKMNNFTTRKSKVKFLTGFTLIEIMVAVSIFVIVAFIVTPTLLAILDAGRRANKIRLIIDNMNFALDSMTVKMKFGSDYNPENNEMEFFDRNGEIVCYKRLETPVPGADDAVNGGIYKCAGCNGDCESITTDEINVTRLNFEMGKCDNQTCINKEIVILVEAQTMIKGQVTQQLDFQTAVSQAQSQTND